MKFYPIKLLCFYCFELSYDNEWRNNNDCCPKCGKEYPDGYEP